MCYTSLLKCVTDRRSAMVGLVCCKLIWMPKKRKHVEAVISGCCKVALLQIIWSDLLIGHDYHACQKIFVLHDSLFFLLLFQFLWFVILFHMSNVFIELWSIEPDEYMLVFWAETFTDGFGQFSLVFSTHFSILSPH